jgi:di/tricarboxylate transporter
MSIAIVLVLLAAALLLFSTERVSVDIVTLIMLVALVLSRILTIEEAFSGFSNEIIVILASLFVISGALERSGLMDALGSWLARIARGSCNRLVLIVMALVSFISAFMNNTTATAVMLAPVLGVARRSCVSPSKVLMPLAFASVLGGTCTLIGTSTNVAVSGYLAKAGLPPLGMFEFTPIGLIIVAVGIAYMVLLGQRLLPEHKEEPWEQEMREYLSDAIVLPESPLVGQRLFASDLSKMGLRVLKILRDGRTIVPDPQTEIRENDRYLVQGKREDLLKLKVASGIDIVADVKLGEPGTAPGDLKVVEMIVTPQSDLRKRTLAEADFRDRYGLSVIAIHRHNQALREKLSEIRLHMGDVLLVQGPAERLTTLRRHPDLWTLEELPPVVGFAKAASTVACFAAAIALSAIGVLDVPIAFLMAAIACVLARTVTVEESYELIDWRLLIMIGGMTAFGTAMEKSGAARFLASWIVHFLAPGGIMVVLGGFVGLTVLLTQPMSNAAAALVVLPVAIETARKLDANPRTFAIAVMLGASVSFLTPFEPSCILVYGPGKYRFRDFVKVGSILTAILVVVVLALLPVFWPLRPTG